MSIIQPYPMAPGATLDFVVNWSPWLAAGDTLALTSSAASLDAANFTVVPGSAVVNVGAGTLTFKGTLSPTCPINKTFNAALATGRTANGLVDPRVLKVVCQLKGG